MPNMDVPAFDALTFRDFVAELNRLEKLRHTRPHYPQAKWHAALAYADRRHTARALNAYRLAADLA